LKDLNDEEKKLIKGYFNEWLDVEDSIKTLREDKKGFVDQAATILEVKKGVVAKLFGFLKKKIEDGNTELDTLAEISEELGM
jgi:hypothetical protein